MKEGYLQNKIRDLNESISELEQKEKILIIRYEKMEEFYNNKLENTLKNIEIINKTKQEIDELPKKTFEYVKNNLDQIIHNKFLEQWKEVENRLKEIFGIQAKINANEFKQIAKRYIADNMGFEIELGCIRNILINKKIMTMDDANKFQKEYKKRVKPLLKEQLGMNSKIVFGDTKLIDTIIGSDFESQQEMEDIIKENKKILNRE